MKTIAELAEEAFLAQEKSYALGRVQIYGVDPQERIRRAIQYAECQHDAYVKHALLRRAIESTHPDDIPA